jgi:hypothetical protein
LFGGQHILPLVLLGDRVEVRSSCCHCVLLLPLLVLLLEGLIVLLDTLQSVIHGKVEDTFGGGRRGACF